MPSKPKPRPVTVDDRIIATVATSLKRHERERPKQGGDPYLRSPKTRARFLVLATTGRRPAEVQRTVREDVDLARRLWFTRTAKGGRNTVIALNDEMCAAWQLFIEADAFGPYDGRSFAKTLRRNGWPAGIRPYNLRHSTAIAIRARGGDLEDVQDHLGHSSIQMAREFYLHAIPERQAAVSQLLDGRFTPDIFAALPRTTPTNRQGPGAKAGEFRRDLRGVVIRGGKGHKGAAARKRA